MSLQNILQKYIKIKDLTNIILEYSEEICSQCGRKTHDGENCTGKCKKWLCTRCELKNWCNYRLNNYCYYCMIAKFKNLKL